MRLSAPALAAAALACLAAAVPARAQTPDARPPSETDGSFDAALRRVLPLTPAMVEELRRKMLDERRAAARVDDPASYVTPVNRRIAWSPRPGEATPIVHVAVGYPTVVSFYDNTGRPWPVAGDSNSNPSTGQGVQVAGGPNGNGQRAENAPPPPSAGTGEFGGFEAKRPVPGGNSVEITARTPFPRGGLVVYLQGADKPVALMLVAGRGQYDANTAVQVAARGPNAAVGTVVRRDFVGVDDDEMDKMLAGITPQGARAVPVAGGAADDARAWRLRDAVYVRIAANIVAPEPNASRCAEGGLCLYSVPVSRHGATTLIFTDGSQNFPITLAGN